MNFCGIIDIKLTIEGENGTYTVTGQYDIGQWYKNAITTAEQAYWGDFFMALKELGDTQYAYRIEVEE